MASRLRVFSSSVGTKLLIGNYRLRTFPLSHHPHRRKPGGLSADATLSIKYSHTLANNPLVPIIEVGLVADLRHPHLQDREDVSPEPTSAACSLCARRNTPEHRVARHSASSTMIVSGIWLLVFVVIHVKAFKLRDRACAPGWPASTTLCRTRDGELCQSIDGGLLRASRCSIVGSHLWHGVSSASQSLGADQPAVDSAGT